jgi:hypothetical protein
VNLVIPPLRWSILPCKRLRILTVRNFGEVVRHGLRMAAVVVICQQRFLGWAATGYLRRRTIARTGSLRNRTLEKTTVYLFRLRRGQLASTKRADIHARRRATYQHGHLLLLYRHLGANGAAGAATGRVRTEEACPLRQPLVESFRTVLPCTGREYCCSRPKKTSDEF